MYDWYSLRSSLRRAAFPALDIGRPVSVLTRNGPRRHTCLRSELTPGFVEAPDPSRSGFSCDSGQSQSQHPTPDAREPNLRRHRRATAWEGKTWHPMTALRLMLRPVDRGWAVYLTTAQEPIRYRDLCSNELALRYLERYMRTISKPRDPPPRAWPRPLLSRRVRFQSRTTSRTKGPQ